MPAKPLPSASLIPALRRIAGRKRLPHYASNGSDDEMNLVDNALDRWTERLGNLPSAQLTLPQQHFAAVDAFVHAINDGNLIIGVLSKRPHLTEPARLGAIALSLAPFAALIAKIPPLLPPPEHARSKAAREAWYDTPAGDKSARRADSLWWRLMREEERVFQALLRWALKHEADFFGKGRNPAAPRRAANPSPRPARPTAHDKLSSNHRTDLARLVEGKLLQTPAATALAGEIFELLQDDSIGGKLSHRKTAALVCHCHGAIQSDGFLHLIMNEPELQAPAVKAFKAIGLPRCAAAIAAIGNSTDPSSPRIARLESRYNAAAGELSPAILGWCSKHPDQFFEKK